MYGDVYSLMVNKQKERSDLSEKNIIADLEKAIYQFLLDSSGLSDWCSYEEEE